MKNLKKLVIASFMLVIAFVAVVSSTYAWFTSSSDAKVNDITIGVVDASKSLLISRDRGQTWGKNVSYNFQGKYTPVTLVTGTNNNQINFYELDTDDNLNAYYMGAVELLEDSEVEGYVKLDLYFQVDAKDDSLANTKIAVEVQNVHAFKANDITAAKAVENSAFTGETAVAENPYALSSFRIAFAENGTKINRIVEKLRGATSPDLEGKYGEGNQFRKTNAWMQRYAVTPTSIVNGGIELSQGTAEDNYFSKGAYVALADNADYYELNAATKDTIYAPQPLPVHFSVKGPCGFLLRATQTTFCIPLGFIVVV